MLKIDLGEKRCNPKDKEVIVKNQMTEINSPQVLKTEKLDSKCKWIKAFVLFQSSDKFEKCVYFQFKRNQQKWQRLCNFESSKEK